MTKKESNLSQNIKVIFYWSPEQQPHLFPASPFHPFMRVLKLEREGAFQLFPEECSKCVEPDIINNLFCV